MRAVAESGALFDIEVQNRAMDAMNDRSCFYGSRLMGESFHEGDRYENMPRVRVINLLNFVMRDSHPDFLQPIGVMYKKAPAEVASDAFRIYNIELAKIPRGIHDAGVGQGRSAASLALPVREGLSGRT